MWDAAELLNEPVSVDEQIGWDDEIPSDDGGDGNHGGENIVMGDKNNGGVAGNNKLLANAAGNPVAALMYAEETSVTEHAARLNHMRQFLRQDGGGIPEGVLEGNYDGLVGYL